MSEAPATGVSAPRPTLSYRLAEPADIAAISALHAGAPESLYRHEYWTYLQDRAVFMTAWSERQLVGTQAFIPYHMHVDGRRMLTGRSERTLVSPTQRGGNVFHEEEMPRLGLVVVIVTVDSKTGEVVTGPEIVTRGWVYAPEAEELLEEAKAAVLASLQEAADEGATDFDTLRRHCRRSLGKFINERTKRRPAVIPVVMEV